MIEGQEALYRAAQGDLVAQRCLVLQYLVPRLPGEAVPIGNIEKALGWARIAYANGGVTDLMRLVTVLFQYGEAIVATADRDTVQDVEGEIAALLAKAAAARGPWGEMARGQLEAMAPCLEPQTASLARFMLDAWGEPADALNEALAAVEAPQPVAVAPVEQAAPDQGQIASFHALGGQLMARFGLELTDALLLISEVEDAGALLATPQGWEAIARAVAARLGVEPTISVTIH